MSDDRITPCAESFDFIRARLREIEAAKQAALAKVDVAEKMSESAKPAYIDYCGFVAMSRESAAWQAEWVRRNTTGANVA